MGGIVENADLLTALNQQVQAINDLATAISALVLECNVDNTCAPVTNLECTPQVTLYSYCAPALATGGGSKVAAPNAYVEDPPPPGYEPPDPETQSRKCKVSNFIYDQTLLIIQKLLVLNVEQYGVAGFVLCSALFFGILGTYVPIAGTLIGAVAGAVAAAVVILVTGGAVFSLSDLAAVYEANHTELVMALYNSNNTAGAQDAFLGVLADGGATTLETDFVYLLLQPDLMLLLFFTIAEYEPALDGWPTAVECE